MNKNRPKGDQKHIDLSGRIRIEQGLNNGESFRKIAKELGKDPSTISKEVRRHSILKERNPEAFGPVPCANNYDPKNPRKNACTVMHLCGDEKCSIMCVLCMNFRCGPDCRLYKPRECEKLTKPPMCATGARNGLTVL